MAHVPERKAPRIVPLMPREVSAFIPIATVMPEAIRKSFDEKYQGKSK